MFGQRHVASQSSGTFQGIIHTGNDAFEIRVTIENFKEIILKHSEVEWHSGENIPPPRPQLSPWIQSSCTKLRTLLDVRLRNMPDIVASRSTCYSPEPVWWNKILWPWNNKTLKQDWAVVAIGSFCGIERLFHERPKLFQTWTPFILFSSWNELQGRSPVTCCQAETLNSADQECTDSSAEHTLTSKKWSRPTSMKRNCPTSPHVVLSY